ncbi:MAG: prolyl oligopeptidase family serine peptidase [Steroidobacteraceae bacterium]
MRTSTLWLFSSAEVNAWLQQQNIGQLLKAHPLLRMANDSNELPISQWRWSGDSGSLLFLAGDDDGVEHLYRVFIDGKLEMISRPNQSVYGFSENADALVYCAGRAIRSSQLYQAAGPTLGDMEDGTGRSSAALLFPNLLRVWFHTDDCRLWKMSAGQSVPVPVMSARHAPIYLDGSAKLTLAADGRQLLTTIAAKRIPGSWKQYRGTIGYSGPHDSALLSSRTGIMRPLQYAIVNLLSGAVSPLLDAPVSWDAFYLTSMEGAWSPGGSAIAVAGTYPPAATDKKDFSVGPCAVAIIGIKSKSFSCVPPGRNPGKQKDILSVERVTALVWQAEHTLVVRYATMDAPKDESVIRYTKGLRGGWSGRDVVGDNAGGALHAEVVQGINSPPMLVAAMPGRQERVLLDPNPQLEKFRLGVASLYRWKSPDGYTWSGVLMRPPDFRLGRRYPLVIQTHGFGGEVRSFLVDGPSHTGYAARALAARDILVLQVIDASDNADVDKSLNTPREAETFSAGYLAAIRQLTRDRLIDSHRVGIMAWSLTGLAALQSLEDYPGVYRAAVLAEGNSGSYPEYLTYIDTMGSAGEYFFRAEIGPRPWKSGLPVWVSRSPGFNTDRICTPVLDDQNSPFSLVSAWDDYAIMRAEKKPIELLYIRNGQHELVKPKERMREQQWTVAWFDYWLNGREDPSLVGRGEIRRWRVMRTRLPACPEPLGVGDR